MIAQKYAAGQSEAQASRRFHLVLQELLDSFAFHDHDVAMRKVKRQDGHTSCPPQLKLFRELLTACAECCGVTRVFQLLEFYPSCIAAFVCVFAGLRFHLILECACVSVAADDDDRVFVYHVIQGRLWLLCFHFVILSLGNNTSSFQVGFHLPPMQAIISMITS
jgi:hypothetical protein